jgi:hypothetical protein
VVTYSDANNQVRRTQFFDGAGVCIFLHQQDATGNGAGLSYELDSNYSTQYYAVEGEGSVFVLDFTDDHKLLEMKFYNMYGGLHSLIAFDNQQRIYRKAELSDTDPYLWHYWVYDKKGRIREEGFTYNQAKFGEWKFYNRKGRMKKTKDLGPRPKP